MIPLYNDPNKNYENQSFPDYIENKDHPFFEVKCSIRDNSNKFSSTDTYERFQLNLLKRPNDWHYRTKEIVYNINNSGYRTQEWNDIDWKESIVILGCSCTYGVGLAEDETISHNVEKLTGRPTINLGVPGISNQAIVQNLSILINNFPTPYAVIINWTGPDRFRYFFNDMIYDGGAWDLNNTSLHNGLDFRDLYLKNCHKESNIVVMNYFNSSIAKSIVKDKSKYINFSFFSTSASYTKSEIFFPYAATSRDLIHPGRESAIQVSKYIKQRLG